MSIEFPCCECRHRLRVPDEAAAKRVRCPDCGTIQEVAVTDWPAAASSAFEPWKEPAVPLSPLPSLDTGPGREPNPYQSPQFQPAPGFRFPVPRQAIESKVQGPAIALITMAILMLALLGMALTVQLVTMIAVKPAASEIVLDAIGAALAGSLYLVVLLGAIRMRKLKSYWLAVTAAVLVLMPCSGCCFVSMPCGVWALVVLLNQDVRAAFD